MSATAVTINGMLRVLIAVARKDLRLFRRYPLNLLSRIVEPIGWLVPVYFLGRTFARDGQIPGFAAWTGTTDFMAFVVAGWVLSSYVSAVIWGMGFALKNEMDSGVLESNWISPQPPVLLLAGRTVASIIVTTLTSTGFGALAVLVFDISIRAQVLPALAIVAPAVVGLYGFGFIVAGTVLRMREANTLIDTGNFVLGILTGRDFPVRVLPRPLLVISLLLPLTYGYDGLRAVTVGTRTLLPLPLEIGVMVVFMAGMVALGTRVFARLERRCRLEGTLSQH